MQQNVETPSADAGIQLEVEKKPMLSDEAVAEIEEKVSKNQKLVEELQTAYASHPSPLQPDKVDLIRASLTQKSEILSQFPFEELFSLQGRLEELAQETDDPRLIEKTEQTTDILNTTNLILANFTREEVYIAACERENAETETTQLIAQADIDAEYAV